MVRPFRKIKHITAPKHAAEKPAQEKPKETKAQPEAGIVMQEETHQPQPEEEEREETPMGRFQVGQKVKFRPTHAKEMQLTGTIKQIDENNPNSLVVTAQPGGENAKAIEVERDFEASAQDATEVD